VPAWFDADCADVCPRIQYVTAGQGPEELRVGGPEVLSGGGMGLSICIGHVVGISLATRRNTANYCGPVGVDVL